jgi:tRNA(Ile)-lysidine synthase TilS/MesJ
LFEMADAVLGEASLLATAHHKDDRAETVLLRLLRGTSLEGLSVLSPRTGRLLRPMIRAPKRAVVAHVERHQVPSVADPSNLDPHYLRVRVRNELLPLLSALGPGIVDHLVQVSDEAALLPAPLLLNSEQRSQFRRALQDDRIPVNLRLPGGLVLFRESRNIPQED